jgi:hypothetical protein
MSTRTAEGREYREERTGRRVGWAETKPSSMTTEFYAMIAATIATIVAGESNNGWDDRWVWQVVGAIAIGYMISRGPAKSGSVERRGDACRDVGRACSGAPALRKRMMLFHFGAGSPLQS